MDANTTIWLSKPHAPQDAGEVEGMRLAIEADGHRSGSLAAHCLEAARARGLSAEDTYLFLAYEALLQLEESQQRHIILGDSSQENAFAQAGGLGAEVATRARELL
jgi:hypothetical protein